MQPIFPEYARFLSDHGCDVSWFTENTFWVDHNLIKAFTQNGELASLYKIYVSDSLDVSLSRHKKNSGSVQFETWADTVQRFLPHIEQIEEASISKLKEYCHGTDREIVCLNSTGKDSMVTMHLAEMAGLQFDTYFNVTTLDVAESNRMANRLGFKKILPERKYGGFYQYIQPAGNVLCIPSRLNRFCCNYFKERPTIAYFDAAQKLTFLMGMRNSESAKRSAYGDIWRNTKWGARDWLAVLPIREWSEFDVWLYILLRNIEVNPKYRYGYDRVGCGIACPNYTKYTWVLDQYWYPKMYTRWREILRRDFIQQNKWLVMNCTIDEYLEKAWPGGVVRSEPTDEVIREFAEYSGLQYDVACKYFNRYCANGCLNTRKEPKRIKSKEVLAMNMKMFGRNIDRFLCRKCLMKELGWDVERWNAQVNSFHRQGCQLF